MTHDKYSFYNPKQHPMFDQEGGRIIYFEGTYTTTFSGNPDPTPRYDYNQVMYRLDLSDPRLQLPVAVYAVPSAGGSSRLATSGGLRDDGDRPSRAVAFFALDRPGEANLPVYGEVDAAGRFVLRVGSPPPKHGDAGPAPLFYLRADDPREPLGTCVRLYEYVDEVGGNRSYSVDAAGGGGRTTRRAHPLGRVWPNPAGSLRW